MNTRVPWRGALATGLVAGGLAPLVCQLLPSVNILTHEYSQVFTVWSGVVLYFFAAWVVGRVRDEGDMLSPAGRMRLGLGAAGVAALTMAAVSLGLMVLFNALGPNCYVHKGVAFYWVTWTPTAFLAAVGGTVLGARGWRWKKLTAMLFLVVAVSLVHDLIQVLMGGRVTDLLIGAPLGFDQRAAMKTPHLHLYQRTTVLLIALFVWQLGLWRAGRRWGSADLDYLATVRAARNRTLLLGAVLAVVIFGAGSHVGIGWGKGAVHLHLSKELRTEHFVFRYPPGGDAEKNMPAIARAAEWDWKYLCESWEVAPEKPVHIQVYNRYGDVQEYTGMGPHALIRTINLDTRSALDSTLLHELVHAIHIELDAGVRVALSRGMCEGLAMAYENHYATLPEAHRMQAGAARSAKLPSAAIFMKPFGFKRLREGNAYRAAGSFIGFLIHEYGIEKFKELQDSPNYKRVYGMDLEGLDAAWREFLAKVPVDLETQQQAAESYDTELWPGYLEKCCPKLGERVPPLEDIARSLWYARDYEGARAVFMELHEKEGKTRWAYQAAQCLRNLERFDEAVALLDGLLADTDLPKTERGRLLKAKVPCLMARQDWPALYATLDARNELEKEPPEDRRIVETCLRNETYRSAVAKALSTRDGYERRRLIEDLAETHPDDDNVAYLYVSRTFGSLYPASGLSMAPERKALVNALLEHVEQSPGAADENTRRLIAFAEKALHVRDFDFAQHILDAMTRFCKEERHRHQAGFYLKRLVFEQDYAHQ